MKIIATITTGILILACIIVMAWIPPERSECLNWDSTPTWYQK